MAEQEMHVHLVAINIYKGNKSEDNMKRYIRQPIATF